MRDVFGDRVEAYVSGENVTLAVADSSLRIVAGTPEALLTPAKARKLARKLKRAAADAERYGR